MGEQRELSLERQIAGLKRREIEKGAMLLLGSTDSNEVICTINLPLVFVVEEGSLVFSMYIRGFFFQVPFSYL